MSILYSKSIDKYTITIIYWFRDATSKLVPNLQLETILLKFRE